MNNHDLFSTKTMEGKIIEGFIGIVCIVIFSPIMLVAIVGSFCGKILDRVVELERNICENLAERGL